MTNEQTDKFRDDIVKLMKAYGLKHGSFIGTVNEDEKFFAFSTTGSNDTLTTFDIFAICLNIGRYWQHMRGQVKDILNEFERKF